MHNGILLNYPIPGMVAYAYKCSIQEADEQTFQSSLGYTVRSCQKINKQIKSCFLGGTKGVCAK